METKPAALEKAESLYRFALAQGAKPADYHLTLTTAEGIEILDWFMAQHPNNELLADDIDLAKEKFDPWPVLMHFTLMGLNIVKREDMH